MIVLDASCVVDMLLRTPAGDSIVARLVGSEEQPQAPDVIYLEVLNALRRYAAVGELTASHADIIIGDLLAFAMTIYPHAPLARRIWELRHNLTPYDAAYVALAEELDAPLLTRDRRLAKAKGHRAKVEVV